MDEEVYQEELNTYDNQDILVIDMLYAVYCQKNIFHQYLWKEMMYFEFI